MAQEGESAMRVMRVVKRGRKWVVEGPGDGWVLSKTFRTKWKALLALEVFTNGGGCSDYWRAARKRADGRVPPVPWRALETVGKALAEIEHLTPSCDEIVAYGEQAGYGTVTISKTRDYFPPRVHDTWGEKPGGRVHTAMGCDGYHLMLDKNAAWDFIEFIKMRRGATAAPDEGSGSG